MIYTTTKTRRFTLGGATDPDFEEGRGRAVASPAAAVRVRRGRRALAPAAERRLGTAYKRHTLTTTLLRHLLTRLRRREFLGRSMHMPQHGTHYFI